MQQAFDRPAPAEKRHDHRDATPHIVKGNNEGTERKVQKPGVEDAKDSFLPPIDEELGPPAWLHDVRQANHETANRHQSFNCKFHYSKSTAKGAKIAGRSPTRPLEG